MLSWVPRLARRAVLAGWSVFEVATGRSGLPTSLPEGVRVVGVAHLAGLACGVIAAAAQAATENWPGSLRASVSNGVL